MFTAAPPPAQARRAV